jgi:uncharacterized protein YkwD
VQRIPAAQPRGLFAALALSLAICATTSVALGAALAAGPRHRASTARACPHASLMPTAHDLALNRERVAHGERPLRTNARLQRAAQEHTHSMAFDDYFEHVGAGGPGGGTPLTRLRAVGYISSSRSDYEIGENIAWGTLWLATPSAIVGSWMRSPGHRANVLDPRYRETGIGVCAHPPASLAQGQPGAIYTQDFGVIIRG